MTLKNLLLPFFFLPVYTWAASYTLELKPDSTQITWTLGDVLHTVHGTFLLKRGTIACNDVTGEASGQIVVDVASGQSGSDARDRRMHAGVLESKKYPEAIFTPAQIHGMIAPEGVSDVSIRGKFTMHGAAHEVEMHVHLTAAAGRVRAAIDFPLPYVAWGMKDPSNFLFKVEKTVQVSINASGTLQHE